MRILIAAGELFPLVKTGGLADAVAGLASALAASGHEIRIALPAYRGIARQASGLTLLGTLSVRGQLYRVYQGTVPRLPPLWLFDCAPLFDRAGDPYHDEYGNPFLDNAFRFGTFCEAVARVSQGEVHGDFDAEVVHANDWHTGLVLPWLEYLGASMARVYTIHSLAHQGVFPSNVMEVLGLPWGWWHTEGVEFHDQLSFMKAGIAYAHRITTVSPTYAREILTAGRGEGLDGLLRARSGLLTGIVNGIDTNIWNPETDPHLVHNYGIDNCGPGKLANRRELQCEMGLTVDEKPLFVGCVTRLAYQKGMDLLVSAMTALMALPVQIAMVGSGDRSLGDELEALASRWTGRLSFYHGYNEALAHRIEGSVDTFLMPSRYEPCGLNQLYSQRYGTPPIVCRTGGLADTVTDANPGFVAQRRATGVQIERASVHDLLSGVSRALVLRADSHCWRQMQRAGMQKDFSWQGVVPDYLAVYQMASAGASRV